MSNNKNSELIDSILWEIVNKANTMRSDVFWNARGYRTEKEQRMIDNEMKVNASIEIAKFLEYRSVLVNATYIPLIPDDIRFDMLDDMIKHIDSTLSMFDGCNDIDEIEYCMNNHKAIDDFILYVKYGFNIEILRKFIEHFHTDKNIISTLDVYSDKSYFNEFAKKYAIDNFNEDWLVMRNIYFILTVEYSELNEFYRVLEKGLFSDYNDNPHVIRFYKYDREKDKQYVFSFVLLNLGNKTIDVNYGKTFQYSEYKEATKYLIESINNNNKQYEQ